MDEMNIKPDPPYPDYYYTLCTIHCTILPYTIYITH